MRVRELLEAPLARIPFLQGAFVIALSLITSSYWYTQIVQGAEFRELAEHNRLRRIPVRAPRGLIYDRNGIVLVENIPSYDLLLDRSRSRDTDEAFAFAANILGTSVESLGEILNHYQSTPAFKPVLIAEKLSLSQVTRFSTATLEFPEFEIAASPLRLYRHGAQTAHLLGYLGEVTEEELREGGSNYRGGDLVGKKGVERRFDDSLRGVDGERVVVVDSHGRLSEEYGSKAAISGKGLKLTLDLQLQQAAVRFLADKVGAAVALDPQSGEILVLVSSPSFDANSFARRLGHEEWQAIVDSPHDPLQNRAIQNTYPLGSVFKIVMGVAGLSESAVTESDAVYCNGSVKLYDRRVRCWKRSGHGWMRLHSAIRESCDVYFYLLGQKLGISKIAHYARLFGLGNPTGIEIGGEKRGLVPDGKWSLETRGHPWYPGETISVAIGQGPLLVTPLQVAAMMATVANGGKRVTPYLVQGLESHASPIVDLDPAALDAVRRALWAVVNEKGTGAAARVEDLEVAGKTSTVQVIRQKTRVRSDQLPFEQRDHAWFASFAVQGNKKLVVVVFVEHGGRGSVAAAPLAKILYEIYYGLVPDARHAA